MTRLREAACLSNTIFKIGSDNDVLAIIEIKLKYLVSALHARCVFIRKYRDTVIQQTDFSKPRRQFTQSYCDVRAIGNRRGGHLSYKASGFFCLFLAFIRGFDPKHILNTVGAHLNTH